MVVFCATALCSKINLLPSNNKPEVLEKVATQFPDTIIINDVWLRGKIEKNADIKFIPKVSASETVAIVFTSGSTGEPKPLKKTWGMLSGAAQLIQNRFKLTNTLLIPTVASQHMYGLEAGIFLSLHGKNTLYVGNAFYAEDIALAVNVMRPGLLISTPIHLSMLSKASQTINIENVLSATSILSKTLCKNIEQKWTTTINEVYGFSEAGSIATRTPSQKNEWHLLSGITISYSEPYEVQAKHLPHAEAFHDKIIMSSPQYFRLLGRSDDIIDIAGKRTSLSGLNQQVLAIEGVIDAVVFIPEGRLRLAALVKSSLSQHQLKLALSKVIDDIFIPRPLLLVSHIERGPTGKISKASLMEQFLNANSS